MSSSALTSALSYRIVRPELHHGVVYRITISRSIPGSCKPRYLVIPHYSARKVAGCVGVLLKSERDNSLVLCNHCVWKETKCMPKVDFDLHRHGYCSMTSILTSFPGIERLRCLVSHSYALEHCLPVCNYQLILVSNLSDDMQSILHGIIGPAGPEVTDLNGKVALVTGGALG